MKCVVLKWHLDYKSRRMKKPKSRIMLFVRRLALKALHWPIISENHLVERNQHEIGKLSNVVLSSTLQHAPICSCLQAGNKRFLSIEILL